MTPACALPAFASVGEWSDASPSWTSCPLSTSVASRPRRPSASPFPSRRRSSARATTSSGRTSCSTGPDGVRRPPGADGQAPEQRPTSTPSGSPPTPRARGPSRSRPGATRSPPGSTTPRSRSRAGVDVELMFTEGRLLLERVAAVARPGGQARARGARGCDRGRGRHRAPDRGPAGRPAGPRAERAARQHPLPRPRHRRGPVPGLRRPERAPSTAAGTSSSRAPRARPATTKTGKVDQRHLPHRREAAGRGRRDGLRRHLPPADPPDRRGQPQGAEQHPRRPGPTTPARRGRSAARTAATTPSTPTSAPSRTSTRSSPGPASSASRSRSTSPCRPPPTTRG